MTEIQLTLTTSMHIIMFTYIDPYKTYIMFKYTYSYV